MTTPFILAAWVDGMLGTVALLRGVTWAYVLSTAVVVVIFNIAAGLERKRQSQ